MAMFFFHKFIWIRHLHDIIKPQFWLDRWHSFQRIPGHLKPQKKWKKKTQKDFKLTPMGISFSKYLNFRFLVLLFQIVFVSLLRSRFGIASFSSIVYSLILRAMNSRKLFFWQFLLFICSRPKLSFSRFLFFSFSGDWIDFLCVTHAHLSFLFYFSGTEKLEFFDVWDFILSSLNSRIVNIYVNLTGFFGGPESSVSL